MLPGIVFRADGGREIGMGHVARCFAMAEQWARPDRGVFVAEGLNETWRTRLRELSIEIASPPDFKTRSNWATVRDGYSAEVSRFVGGTGPILEFDDFGNSAGLGNPDVLVDQNGWEHRPASYSRARRLLGGPRYAALRRELRDRRRAGPRDDVAHVALSAGGAPAAEVRGFFSTLSEEFVKRGLRVRLLDGSDRVADVFEWADAAVTTAGSTVWELCHFGVPSYQISTASNQVDLARQLAHRGLSLGCSDIDRSTARGVCETVVAKLNNRDDLAKLERRCELAVDGMGTTRIFTALLSSSLGVRRATADDSRQLWEWANDPDTRRWSFRNEPIAWSTHVDWFNRLTSRNDALQLIVTEGSRSVGQFRVEFTDDEWLVAVAVAPENRGRGLGGAVVDVGARASFRHLPAAVLTARVKPDNRASRRSFIAGDFDLAADTRDWVTYTRERDEDRDR